MLETLNSETLCLLTVRKIAQVNPSNDNNILRLHTMSQVLFTLACQVRMVVLIFFFSLHKYMVNANITATQHIHRTKEDTKKCIMIANLLYCGFQCEV